MDLSTVSDAVMGGAAVPVYRLMQGNKDITGRFQGRLISLTLTDNRGFEADQLDIELDDADGALSLPDKGATLSLGIGWQDTGVVDKGRYKVDELEHSGPPDRLTIRARSVDLAGGMTLRKERSFRGQTIGAIVGAIASKNALAAIVASALAGLVIDHIDQTSESDANFLTRLAKDHDAIATVKHGKLLFIKTGAAQSASGIALPTVEITRASGDTHSFLIADRENYNGVKAYYQDARRAVKGEVVIDASNAVKVVTKPSPKKSKKKGAKKTVADVMVNPNPDNVKVLRHTYASKSNAERAARAEWQRIQRGVASFRITLARGRPDLFPELPAIVRGWKSEIDNTGWIITKVTHNLSDHGYTSTLELEIKPESLDLSDPAN
ncbi:phage late control D family protein [Cupriavidus pauculus]|uniref:phage late control D family protein n=1 Tax=Cupriavidus pauculus TaxID=82633 RepID=UPI001CBC26D9|nr:phage late control D family protein [Cupriavidus pauculus]